MYKQFETVYEITEQVSELLRAANFAKLKTKSSQHIVSAEDSTTLKIYVDINGLNYLIEYAQGLGYETYRLDSYSITKKDLLNELSKLTQTIEEYEEALCA